MDLFSFMQPLAILACAVAGYAIIYRERKQRRNNGHYTLPGKHTLVFKFNLSKIQKLKSALLC